MIKRSANPGENTSFSLLDETALETGDLIFTTEEVSRFDYTFLRNLAANARSEEINGKSNRLVIETYYARQRTLTDFEE